MRLFAISGSLRADSTNTKLLRTVQRLAPHNLSVEIFDALEQIPPFNPDREGDAAPTSVAALRADLKSCDVLLVSTPEYAHGVPGVLKNALDWVVGSGELYEKPVAILQTSAERGQYAHASLKETFAVMGTRLVCDAAFSPDMTNEAQLLNVLRKLEDAVRNASDSPP